MLHLLPLELQHYIVFELCWIVDWAAVFAVWPHLYVNVTLAENTVKKSWHDYRQVWYLVKRSGQFVQTNGALPTDKFYCGVKYSKFARNNDPGGPLDEEFVLKRWTRRIFEIAITTSHNLYYIKLEKGWWEDDSDLHVRILFNYEYTRNEEGIITRPSQGKVKLYNINKKKALQEWSEVELPPEFVPLKPFITRMISLFTQKHPNLIFDITPENLLHLY